MASAFGHAAAGAVLTNIYTSFNPNAPGWVWTIGIGLAVLPDLDVVGFWSKIPYHSLFGHRGFTHSIFFAGVISLLTGWLMTKTSRGEISFFGLFCFFFATTLSHGFLDAMTNGGRGVAFFAPFSNHRYFFPFRPILVSPIGISSFFSSYGWEVIKSESVWIGIPSLLITAGTRFLLR